MLHFPSPDIGIFGRRQRHARGQRTGVTIGRLDAGPQVPDAAVVIDDFGADEMSSGHGCTCCTVRHRLQTALRRIAADRDKGLTHVVIETDKDLQPILRTFATERALGADFYVEHAPPLAGDCFTLTEDAPLPWDAFSRFIATLVALRGADLLHVKGLLNVAGCRGPVEVQYVQHLAHRPIELQVWPDENRRSRVEFVTRNVEKTAVRSLFDAVRALS